MIDGTIKDVGTMCTYKIMNKVLSEINVLDHRLVMKMNKVKSRII